FGPNGFLTGGPAPNWPMTVVAGPYVYTGQLNSTTYSTSTLPTSMPALSASPQLCTPGNNCDTDGLTWPVGSAPYSDAISSYVVFNNIGIGVAWGLVRGTVQETIGGLHGGQPLSSIP